MLFVARRRRSPSSCLFSVVSSVLAVPSLRHRRPQVLRALKARGQHSAKTNGSATPVVSRTNVRGVLLAGLSSSSVVPHRRAASADAATAEVEDISRRFER